MPPVQAPNPSSQFNAMQQADRLHQGMGGGGDTMFDESGVLKIMTFGLTTASNAFGFMDLGAMMQVFNIPNPAQSLGIFQPPTVFNNIMFKGMKLEAGISSGGGGGGMEL